MLAALGSQLKARIAHSAAFPRSALRGVPNLLSRRFTRMGCTCLLYHIQCFVAVMVLLFLGSLLSFCTLCKGRYYQSVREAKHRTVKGGQTSYGSLRNKGSGVSGTQSFLPACTRTEMVVLTSGHPLTHNTWADLPRGHRIPISRY